MFVTGCHRSGTSLVASLVGDVLGQSSVASPQLSAQLDNPQGFFESRQLVELNNELLEWFGGDWSTPPLIAPRWDEAPFLDRLASRRAQFKQWALQHDWVDKDPRLCITYPAYLHLLLRRVPLVAVLRHPLEVATSLYARNGMPLDMGLSLWFLYNHHLSAVFESTDCLLTYDSVLAAVNSDASNLLLARLAPILDFVGINLPADSQWNTLLSTRLKPDLNRAQAALPHSAQILVRPSLLRSCERAYSAVSQTESSVVEAFYEAFEAIPRDLLHLLSQEGRLSEASATTKAQERELESLHAELQTLGTESLSWQKKASQAQQSLCDVERDLQLIKASRSWQATAPLRAIGDLLRGSD